MRSKGLGGTDIAAIAGLNPWKTAMDVYLEKLGLVDGPEDNEAMFWGREMEPVLQKRYEKESGYEVYNLPPDRKVIIHVLDIWRLGSPDGLVFNGRKPHMGPEGGVDYKTTGRRQDYGEPGTDQVPDHVACQAAWYMGLTGAQWWDIAVLFFSPRREFAIYHLKRNQEIIDQLTELGREFWENHIIPQVPPPLDASEGTRRYLSIKYPQDIGDMLPAPGSASEWFSRLQAAKEVIAEAEKDKALAEHWMKDIIGDAAGLIGEGWKATWKRSKDREEVDWKAAFEKMAVVAPKTAEQCKKEHTTIKQGPRVFRVYDKREE